jgi:hypothetical protein
LPGYFKVAEIIAKLTELIENEILWVTLHFVARVINFFYIALCSRRTNDVAWVARPFVEPIKTLLRHARRQHRNTACASNSANRYSTARIVAG